MRAVARLVWLHCTALPVQRWVGAVALATTLPIAATPFWPWARGFAVVSLITIACYAVATTFASAYLFRAMAVPSANRFLPHFRGRSLSAFFGAMVLVSVPWLFAYAAAVAQRPHASLLLVPFFLLTVIGALVFFPRGGLAVVWLCAATLWLIDRATDWRPSLGAAADAHPEVGVAAALGLWLALWMAFSIWYLRVRRIRPHWPLSFGLGNRVFSQADSFAALDAETAATISVTGRHARRARQKATSVLLLALGVFVFLSFLIRHAPGLATWGFFFYPVFGVPAVFLAVYASRRARSTKLLWLRQGLSRLELFAATEKAVWSAAAAVIAMCVLVAMALAFVFGVPSDTLARAVACAIASDVLAVYVALAHVRGSRAFEVAQLAYFVAVSSGLWTVLADPRRNTLLAVVVLVQLVAALALRALALRNWRQIDWLVFRPIRIPRQALRAGR